MGRHSEIQRELQYRCTTLNPKQFNMNPSPFIEQAELYLNRSPDASHHVHCKRMNALDQGIIDGAQTAKTS